MESVNMRVEPLDLMSFIQNFTVHHNDERSCVARYIDYLLVNSDVHHYGNCRTMRDWLDLKIAEHEKVTA